MKDASVVLLLSSTCLKLQLKDHMTCRILIVEDDEGMAQSLTAALCRELGEPQIFVINNFKDAQSQIAEKMPDVVVFDIFDDQIEEHPEYAVKPAWLFVWNEFFCPVVFHTGHEVSEYRDLVHPFVRYEIKGPGSHGRVATHIKEFEPKIDSLRTIRKELSWRAGETLRHVSPLIWRSGQPLTDQADIFLRVVRRRMAAALDHTAEDQRPTQAWEQYIYPPIGDSLLTGDIIRSTSGDENKPESYHLVLSPSCDLVRERPTLKQVLVADCVPIRRFVDKTNIGLQDLVKRLPSELTKDQVAGFTVLPTFPGVLPLMAANLKQLSLLPYDDIATKNGETKHFTRIASLDSPFRERLAWAYLQVAGRPGVPDVDVETLAVAIDQAIKANTKA